MPGGGKAQPFHLPNGEWKSLGGVQGALFKGRPCWGRQPPITLRIIEREEPKCIKFALEGAPIQANLWIQMLPQGDQCAMRLTLKAELNFLIKQMLGKKLEQGVEGLAQMLVQIPY